MKESAQVTPNPDNPVQVQQSSETMEPTPAASSAKPTAKVPRPLTPRPTRKPVKMFSVPPSQMPRQYPESARASGPTPVNEHAEVFYHSLSAMIGGIPSASAFGNSGDRGSGRPERPGNHNIGLLEFAGLLGKAQPISALAPHKKEQLAQFLPKSAFDEKNPHMGDDVVRAFHQCVNEHLFPDNLTYCHICGCPPFGLPLIIMKKDPLVSELDTLEKQIKFTDDNAWKFGFAKCSNKHYYPAMFRACDICGEQSQFYLDDSDSD